ncbi:MAG: histidine kinase, partial [Gammaproteobacteria bacterium]|nr:histidine kinase [Gammaproteobacteria bacterium]
LVQDVMTPKVLLEALDIEDVLEAKVGDIVKTIQRHGRQHVLVTEKDPETLTVTIRAMFSSTQVERQLGTTIAIKPRTYDHPTLELIVND